MTARDRIFAATNGDEESTDMVLDMLRRAHELKPDAAAEPDTADEICPNCLKEYDEAGFCDGCARQRRIR